MHARESIDRARVPVTSPYLPRMNEKCHAGQISSEDLMRFRDWLSDTGASNVTVSNYYRAVVRWIRLLRENQGVKPSEVWWGWTANKATKRLAGFACRRFQD
jgi:hypothetical protein